LGAMPTLAVGMFSRQFICSHKCEHSTRLLFQRTVSISTSKWLKGDSPHVGGSSGALNSLQTLKRVKLSRRYDEIQDTTGAGFKICEGGLRMRILSRRIQSICGLNMAIILLGMAGVARADEAPVRDANEDPSAAFVTVSDDSLAQAAPGAKSPATTPERTISPKTPVKPKTAPVKPPARRDVETPAIPVPQSSRTTGEQPSSNLLASMYGRNVPAAERLAGTPNMFGDLFNNLGGSMVGTTTLGPAFNVAADLPLAAASRRAKISENDKALPQDRVFFLYNHFANSLYMESVPNSFDYYQRSFSVDRYTIGLEKTFLDRCWSVELRMPLAGETDFSTPDFGVSGGTAGNLAVIVKRLIYESDTTAVAVGLGIDTPTGNDVDGFAQVVDVPGLSKVTYFTMHNDAVHILPYMGFVSAPNCRYFYQGFAQLDIPVNGNRIDYQGVLNSETVTSGRLGVLDEQNLMYLDLSGGCWLYRNECARGLTGLASLVEFHYTSTMQDTDVVRGVAYPAQLQLTFSNFANRVDIVNFTVGLHAEFANKTLCRVGAAFPVQLDDNRSFDSEIQVQVERRF
jgi:hypothetical protein